MDSAKTGASHTHHHHITTRTSTPGADDDESGPPTPSSGATFTTIALDLVADARLAPGRLTFTIDDRTGELYIGVPVVVPKSWVDED
jgi:hypothetical protein